MSDEDLYDPATGLPTRRLLRDRIDVAAKQAQRTRDRLGLLYVSIDGIETDGGRAAVPHDTVIREVARRLSSAVRAHDSVARVAPDLFATLSSGDLGERPLALLADRLHVELAAPVSLEGGIFFLTASIGGATYSPDRDLVDTFAERASEALAAARGVAGRTVILSGGGAA